MTASTRTHVVLGQTVAMPVRVRKAAAATAMFSVRADAAQQMIKDSGLEVLRYRPGRALVGLVFVQYVDGDLGRYNEFGVCVLVRSHDKPGPASTIGNLRALLATEAGVLIHRLPVDGEFTMAAGRQIWGFPKELGNFDVDLAGPVKRMVLRQESQLVADLRIRRGIRAPAPGSALALTAYSHLDGVTRHTTWEMSPSGVRSRPGGAELRLGSHPIARELAALGLPRRAMFSTSITNLEMTFGDAEPA